MAGYEQLAIPVCSGTLAAGRWGDGTTVVLASHGITANHLSWQRVAERVMQQATEVSVVAVDHRGRAGSAHVPGPYGMPAHADDLVAVLDHLGVERAVFVGHSMGGFVVANAAERHPDRVARLVLVDGGVPFPLAFPADMAVEDVVRAVIGPALDRLDKRWPDVEAYVDFFRAHPAFAPPNEWTACAEAYVRYDAVVGADGVVRSSVVKDAVLVDGGAAITDPASSSAIERTAVPAVLLWAARGLLDQPTGLYSQELLTDVTQRLPHLTARFVADVNHYTIAVGEVGARAVAAEIVRAVSAE